MMQCVGVLSVAFIIGYVAFILGYVRGYKAGLAYGAKGLEDYHQHTMAGLRSLK